MYVVCLIRQDGFAGAGAYRDRKAEHSISPIQRMEVLEHCVGSKY